MEYIQHIIVSVCSNCLFIVFAVALIGYLFGSIEVKGLSLGTAGVFIIALVYGHFGYADTSFLHKIGLITIDASTMKHDMNLIQNLGLLSFVTSVGFIAGPNFFHNLKKNIRSYVLLAAVIIGSGCAVSVLVTKLTAVDSAMATGLLSGALTTTPGFSAAQDVLAYDERLFNEVSAGYAIAYPFGVVGVVLFVQLIPRILHFDMEEERKRISRGSSDSGRTSGRKYYVIDSLGGAAFAIAVALGMIVGKITVPLPGGGEFSLGNTGGPLLVALILGHFGHMSRFSLEIREDTLKVFREVGLALFLIGAGVPGGAQFVEILSEYGLILFVYGALMTLIPMILGFLTAKYIVKLGAFDSLGSITGGMTSTPALGTLIATAETSDVASSYASTYPIALVLIVLGCQFIVRYL